MKKLLILVIIAVMPMVSSAKYCYTGVEHTLRNSSTVIRFKRLNPCPATGKASGRCTGWIVDHILPLACGGSDSVLNMQWQTKADAKLKDLWEICGDATHQPCGGSSK